MKNLPYIPYFYIIRHKKSSKLYCGIRNSKKKTKFSSNGCNPIELLNEDGYLTSSNIVKDIISKEGTESFEIVQIIEESELTRSVYEYETEFLNNFDLANDELWLNCHNNILYPFGSEEFETMIFKKYGVKNCMELEWVKTKIYDTFIKNWGQYPTQSKEIKEKTKETCLEKYGTNCYLQTQECKNRLKKYCLEKYGVSHPSQAREIKFKKIETSLKNWGTEYPTQSKEIKEKIKETCLEKYGVSCVLQSKEIKEKIKESCLEKYGVDHIMKTDFHKIESSKRQIGYRFVNNGLINLKIFKGEEIPEGFVFGCIPQKNPYKGSRKPSKLKGLSYFHNKNTKQTIRCLPTDERIISSNVWIPGRYLEESSSQKNTSWYHNPLTMETKMIKNTQEIPLGFLKGRSKR